MYSKHNRNTNKLYLKSFSGRSDTVNRWLPYIMEDAKAGRAANGDFGTESPTGSFRAFEVSKQPDLQNADK